MNQAKVKEIFRRFQNIDPTPKTELNFSDDFTLLVAIVLSAQATDVSVNKATKKLYEVAKTPQAILDLGIDGLKNYIKTIGLYNSKAKNIISLCEILTKEYNSKAPNDFDSLIKLPGVGRKTANVFLNCYLGLPTIAVDTHVFRVSNRVGLVTAKNELQTELQLLKAIPQEYLTYAHHWLILHGRYICKARKPECESCLINDLCEYKR